MLNLGEKKIVFFCIVFFGSVNVFAQEIDMPKTETEFQKIDANKDGLVTSKEMQKYQRGEFNELDKDKNGIIDENELKADEMGIFTEADKNKDGKVTRQESGLQFKEYFRQLDSDKNGKVSEDEYTDYWKLRMKF